MIKAAVVRDKCTEQTNDYRIAADNIIREEQAILADIEEDGNENNTVFKRLVLVDSMLNLASNFMVMDGVTQTVLRQRNEEALNDARKALYKSIIYLEGIVGSLIDAPYSEYEEKLARIESITPAERYLLVRKMGLAIQLLKDAYGDNTKWKWTFVELEGRYTTVAKNIINLRDITVNSDFDSPHYEPTIRHLALVKKLLAQAADRYREKYELSTNRVDDFQLGINYLSALRRLCVLTGDPAEALTTKKKLDIWNVKLSADTEKQEKQGKPKKD